MSRVLIYRWIVFLLAVGYVIRQLIFTADYSEPGGAFRYLTHWALILSCFSASRMLAVTVGRSERDWTILVWVTAVANALVVFLYWRLYFQDPILVNNGEAPVWYAEYYIHLLGPILQWIDALFIFRGFRKVPGILAGMAALIMGYVAWIELFVSPMNDTPVGKVTSGLPYPFLNNMEFAERVGFYGSTAAMALMFFALFWAASWGLNRLRA